jgi:hypothetical protein
MPGNADHQGQAVGQRLHAHCSKLRAPNTRFSSHVVHAARFMRTVRASSGASRSDRRGYRDIRTHRMIARSTGGPAALFGRETAYWTTRTAGVIARSAAVVLSAINCDSKAKMRLVFADPFSGTQ